eukprot:c9207_g1_i2.p1 GENE.c9207_g1_i2~~c9207_g1_i2.p1  ORF type:complete len:339 (-),score=67.06 c9207_g1_i2:523-1497(-)
MLQAQQRMRTFAKVLSSPDIGDLEKIFIAQAISECCISSTFNCTPFQNAAADSGCIPPLVHFAKLAAADSGRVAAFQALAQVCFGNESTSHLVCTSDGFLPLVIQTLASPSMSTLVKETALRAATNSAGNSWPDHALFVELVPCVVAIVQDEHQLKELRAECVGFLNVLAYNESSREMLVASRTFNPLVKIMQSGDSRLESTTAAIAVANLVAHQSRPVDEIMAGVQHKLLENLVECFLATLDGKDFPTGSGLYFTAWKLSMGICNLCKALKNKQPFRDAGLSHALEHALRISSKSSSPGHVALAGHSLRALWILNAELASAAR